LALATADHLIKKKVRYSEPTQRAQNGWIAVTSRPDSMSA
jgi:hypothetical protein